MATPQLSPGVLTREVDLTVGRAENVLDNIGAIAGPFAIGPVDEATDISTEQDLINVFGEPKNNDAQYEYWMAASSYLSYGGVLKVVRTAGTTLANANAGVDAAAATMTGANRIDNYDDYIQNHAEASDFTFAAKNPGSWANNLKVCVIDDAADQTLTLASIGAATVGMAVTTALEAVEIPGVGSTSSFTGYLKSIITSVNTTTKVVDVKIVSRVAEDGTETKVDYAEGTNYASFQAADQVYVINNSGVKVGSVAAANTVVDWYDQQTLGLTNSTVYWKSIAGKPKTNKYSLDRAGKNDGIHVVVVDDLGDVTGIQGQILEKHTNLSKAGDAVSDVNSPQKIWYEQFLADYSDNIYAGGNPSAANDTYWNTVPLATGFSSGFTKNTTAQGLWGQNAQGITFSAIGKQTYTLSGGVDYAAGGGMGAALADLITSYGKFSNKDEVEVDYLITGPGCSTKAESQAKANYVISLANERKDCVATISPHRADVVGVTNDDTQTTNVIDFFSTLSSSSYAVFDSGYKYMYDLSLIHI